MATKPVMAETLPSFERPQLSTRSNWAPFLCIFLSDIAAITVVLALSVFGRHIITPAYRMSSCIEYLPLLAIFFPTFLAQGLYPGVLMHPAEEMRRVFYSLCIVFLAWASILFLWHAESFYSRSVFLVAWVLGVPAILFFRHLTRRWCSREGWWAVPAVILGSGKNAQRIARKLRDGMMGIRVAGVFSEQQVLSWASDMPPVLGNLHLASAVARARGAQYAIIAMQDKATSELRQAILDYCSGFRHVLLVPDMQGICSLGVEAREIGGEVGIQLSQRLFHLSAVIVKRSFDVIVSSILLLIFSPLLALIAAAIKLTSDGPVFFRHVRFGRDNQPITPLKFRTMVVDADNSLADYLAAHPELRLEWQRDHKLKKDPRITKIGRWLRRYSLDELPQLFNVFAGSMSLVGPRPIVASEIPKYGRGYALYTRVLPGITGLWQVSGRNNTSYEERVAFDEYYVSNWSIWLDFYILSRTLSVVLTGKGAY